MPEIVGFEETCPLIKNPFEENALVTGNPNSSKESIRTFGRCDLFYFSPFIGFTMDCLQSGVLRHISSPREHQKFFDGVDNLCATVNLRDIIYLPLVTSDSQIIGVLQFINKQYGTVTQDDINLLTHMGTTIANCLYIIMKGVRLSLTADRIVGSVQSVVKPIESKNLL